MTLESWFLWAAADAEGRGLPQLRPLLEALRKATATLRAADWNGDATGRRETGTPPDAPTR